MMKPSKHIPKAAKPKIVDLAAIAQGSESIAYSKPLSIKNEPPQITICGDRPVTNRQGKGAIDGVNWPDDWQGKAAEETGGRSEVSLPPAKVTAKPLVLNPFLNPSIPSPSNPDVIPQSDMPVLGDPMGVHRKEGGKVVQTSHVGGIHSKNSPILGHKESDLVTTSLNVPYSPDVEEPLSTEEVRYGSPFITGNERIDRRTAFTQYCRDGESRTYMKVAERMAVSLETIKEWAKEDNWENAYRERVTADIVQVAKEENIHEVLDIRREVIAQLKQRITDSKNGENVFKSTKELLDTMLKLEELTGASSANNVKPGQIFVIVDREEWEAREKLNETARKEEAKA